MAPSTPRSRQVLAGYCRFVVPRGYPSSWGALPELLWSAASGAAEQRGGPWIAWRLHNLPPDTQVALLTEVIGQSATADDVIVTLVRCLQTA